ncbi:MAG: DDE-type integrase/transposase/recombinase, partial [Paracoccaceae bacterium]
NRFGPMLGSEIKQKRIQQLRSYSKWKCHVDEVFVKINGEHHYLWRAEKIVTDRLRSYGAALRDLGCPREQKTGRSLNIRAENSHHPFRRKRRAMQRFWQMRSLQKFAFVHAFVFNHFNQDRSQVRRAHFKQSRTAALFEWRSLLAGQ